MGRKLRDVRIELQVRLGYGSTDLPQIAPILNSFLREAQKQIYKISTLKDLEAHWDVTAAAGSANVAYPSATGNACDKDKITSVSVNVGTVGSPSWQPVTEGISPSDYNSTSASIPARYERRASGLELLPPRDKDYTLRIFGIRALGALRDDDDTFTIDDDLCFTIALANAKAHYKHADAKDYLGKANSLLASLKWDNVGPKLIKPADKDPGLADPRPVVV